MKKLQESFPKISFGTIIILFFLPFLLVKCGGEEIANLSGFQLVTGTEIGGDSEFGGDAEDIQSNVFAIIGFVCAIAGLIIAFMKINKSKVISLVISIIGLLSLLLLYNDANSEAVKNTEGVITISLGIGYYLTFLCYLINSIFFGYTLKEKEE